MNMQVGDSFSRELQDFSDSALNSLQKTLLQPDSQSGSGGNINAGGGINSSKSISFGSPATSNLPDLSDSQQSTSSSSSSFGQFMQQLSKLLQNALSAIDSMAQQINKAHSGASNTLSTSKPEASGVDSASASKPETSGVESASASSNSAAVSSDSGLDPSRNSMTFENKGDKPMTIAFTPNADGSAKPDDLILQPGETKTQNFDANWSGNFRSTKGDGANATLGEVKFDGSSGQTFYDVSYIEGNNAAMTIGPAKGDGRVSGTLDDLVANAPDSIKAKDADGNVYGLKKSTTANQQDPAVVDYYRQHVAADKGYVIPSDDASTLGSSSKNLKVELK